MKILLIEDEPELRKGIKNYLHQEGYLVESANDFIQASEKVSNYQYDCVLLDITLPKGNGLEIIKKLKHQNSKAGIIIISAKNSLDDKIYGLDLGADDYLSKPFDLAELEARVRALIRRGQVGGSAVIAVGKLQLDTVNHAATYNNASLNLSARELAVLEILMLKVGKVVNKEQMLEKLCNFDEDISDNALEVYLHRLRKKLNHSDINISTFRGLGYMLEAKPVA